MKRTFAATLGRDTLRILEAGCYRAPSGATVSIASDLRRAIDLTASYPPDQEPPGAFPSVEKTTVEVVNESTLAAARRLVDAGHRPVALNFASAKNPGGGFLGGARAQEESLARSSGLFACLEGNPMYDFHRGQRDALYTNYVLYSPDVPVFRDDEGQLLEQPYLCSFITSPAVNAGVVLERDRTRGPEIRSAMADRVEKVLATAAFHGHEALVLGAWGCGVFRNNCEDIAELFSDALNGRFAKAFRTVVFAILDSSEEQRFIGPFRRVFNHA